LEGLPNKGCFVVIAAALVLDTLIAITIILFVNGDWQWATGLTCFIAITLSIVEIAIKWRNSNYCPECGKRLGPMMKNEGGSPYKECSNPTCKLKSISF